jgi:hypothetical protein
LEVGEEPIIFANTASKGRKDVLRGSITFPGYFPVQYSLLVGKYNSCQVTRKRVVFG